MINWALKIMEDQRPITLVHSGLICIKTCRNSELQSCSVISQIPNNVEAQPGKELYNVYTQTLQRNRYGENQRIYSAEQFWHRCNDGRRKTDCNAYTVNAA